MKITSSIRSVLFGLLVVLATRVTVARGAPQRQAESGANAGDPWRLADPFVRAINHGVALMERYEYAAAGQAFEEALGLQPDSIEARLDLANALFNRSAQDDVDRAGQLLDEVLAKEPDNPRGLYFRAIVFQQLGKADQSLPYLERLVKIEPHDGFAWYLLGRSLSQTGKSPREALERSIQENPALTSAYYELMKVTMRAGDRAKAMEYKKAFDELTKTPLPEKLQLPQYREMGPLALVRPLSVLPAGLFTRGELSWEPPRVLYQGGGGADRDAPDAATPAESTLRQRVLGSIAPLALADVNNDSRLDIVSLSDAAEGRLVLLMAGEDGGFSDSTKGSGLEAVTGVHSVAFGDFDDDENVDLYLCRTGPNVLARGRGDGTFEDVTAGTGTAGPGDVSVSAVFVDADHDADLDIYVCNFADAAGDAAANQLFNNNSDGTFTEIAAGKPLACGGDRSIAMAPADLDADRDVDLVVFNASSPARLFLNKRQGRFEESSFTDDPIQAEAGGVVQDFNGDERVDLLVLPSVARPARLYLSRGFGRLEPSAQFDEVAGALATYGRVQTSRVIDVDLDGDLDVMVFTAKGEETVGHLLFNDALGHFVLGAGRMTLAGHPLVMEPADVGGDGLADLIGLWGSAKVRIQVVPARKVPPAGWIALTVTGSRGRDKSKRSPASGYGTRVDVRSGIHGQVLTYTGLNGGPNQSQMPLVIGLDGADRIDYVVITWPDGVTQAENELAAGMLHRLEETERRISSCPVLFSWNGERFTFVGDFAGVGGLGYFASPGRYSQPQTEELIRLSADQLAPRDGLYELRMCEPMEEVAYFDRVVLRAIDHPRSLSVYPDERLAVSGPLPGHALLAVSEKIFAHSAVDSDGRECAGNLRALDRRYAYRPRPDRRFFGFCAPHSLTLDFGGDLRDIPDDQPVYLFVNCSIEYPYSQTIFAAGQADISWEPMRVERRGPDGKWNTLVADAGTPGGMARTIAIDLTGKLGSDSCVLRITTNLEIYYDQLFVGLDRGETDLMVRDVPMKEARLRRLGFPQEYSPDGEPPRIYSYDTIESSASLKIPEGRYTRYGPVEALLSEFDDIYVICGTGDEVAVSFDATALPPIPEGWARDFVLVSNAYCKDMDLYTATGDTVEPLPFRAMSAYPYPSDESFPRTEAWRNYQAVYNVREVAGGGR